MILLDTHALIWVREGNPKLGPHARTVIERAFEENTVAVSPISFWEIAMRVQKGHIIFFSDVAAWRDSLLSRGLHEIPVDGRIAVRAGLLPDLHGDPADRLIVATALEGHRLVTADHRLLEWSGPLNRLDATE